MKITPLDIEKMEFPKQLYGYSIKKVDSFLKDISLEFSELIKQNNALEQQNLDLIKVQKDYKNMESKLQSTLLILQKVQENIQSSAQKEAKNLLEKTKLECNVMYQETMKKVTVIKKEINDLSIFKENLIRKIKFFIDEEAGILKEFEKKEKNG